MKVLGVSFGYHDASACLVVDGEVAVASAEERFTRQKHDPGFPAHAIDYCLERAGLGADDLDQVVFHEDPHAKFSRVLTTALAPFPTSRREFVNSTRSWLGRKLWSLNELSSRLEVSPDKISYLSHHFSHAVQAFMGSGFPSAAILILDAVGDWACTALYRGAWEEGRPRVERILEIAFPNSLGLVYSAFTAYLGFSPNDSECSTMALAGFGRPVYADKIGRIVAELDDQSYRVDQSYFHFANFYRGAVSQAFLDEFGPARSFKEWLPFSTLESPGEAPAEAQRFADIAASVQRVLEERVLALCRKLHASVPSENLCLAGGVSLNCVSNYRILTESPFRNVYIPPDPGDGGTAVGVALYYSALHGRANGVQRGYSPYLGAEFDESDDVRMIDHIDPEHIGRYSKRGVTAPPRRWLHGSFEGIEALCDEVARHLMERRIVGWYQGRSEIGPRALGNRSLLIRPDDLGLARKLSRQVKDRASFRPYAFSVTAEDAPRVLEIRPDETRAHRWMQYAVPVRAEARERLIAALHVDGTTRPQVCHAGDNPTFHALLRRFGELCGIAALLNTSLNSGGYPIVSTPTEAMVLFARTNMDVLVVNRTVIWKQHD